MIMTCYGTRDHRSDCSYRCIAFLEQAKIPKLAKTFGKAKGEFEKGKIEARELAKISKKK